MNAPARNLKPPLERPLNVLVAGASVSANKGAQAMALVALDELRAMAPACRFRLLSKYPAQDAAVAETEGIELVAAAPSKVVTTTLARAAAACLLHLRPRGVLSDSVLRAYGQADLVIDLSGVAFSDQRDWRGLLLSVGWVLPALAWRKPVARLAQAVGPFRKPLNRFLARRLLSRCGLIVARGEPTARELATIFPPPDAAAPPRRGRGPGGRTVAWSVCADTAFLLRPADNARVDATLIAAGAPTGGFIGLSLSAVVDRRRGGEDYRQTMTALIEHIRRTTDRPVVLIPHASAQGASASEDHELHLAITAGFGPSEGVHVLAGEFDARLLKGMIARAEAFVTSRFHAMVAALGSGVPTMVIGWMHKYPETMALFGVENFSHAFASATSETLRTSFDALWSQREPLRRRITAAGADVLDSAAENYRLLRDFIDQACPGAPPTPKR